MFTERTEGKRRTFRERTEETRKEWRQNKSTPSQYIGKNTEQSKGEARSLKNADKNAVILEDIGTDDNDQNLCEILS